VPAKISSRAGMFGAAAAYSHAMSVVADPVLSRIATLLRRTVRSTIDALLPPQCLACGALVADPRTLCSKCWAGVEFIVPPLCVCCGLPFEIDANADSRCAACLARPPSWRQARAVFRYGEHSRRLVLAFKHGDRTDAAPAYAAWMRRAAVDLSDPEALVVPVPLHRWRLLMRRYNQAALLAQAFAAASGQTYAPDLLLRQRATPSQARLSANERRRNVAGAFALNPAWRERLQGKTVLLIDDVLTTGSTIEACTRVLLRRGARAVDVLTLARVVRPRAP